MAIWPARQSPPILSRPCWMRQPSLHWSFRDLFVIAAVVLITAGGFAVPNAANATVTYTYTGAYYTSFYGSLYNNTDHQTISFTVNSALLANSSYGGGALVSLTASDGVYSISNGSAIATTFDVQTGSGGQITSWFIYMLQNDGSSSSNYIQSDSGIAVVNIAENDDQSYYFQCQAANCEEADAANTYVPPGTWNVTSSTSAPEPTSLALFSAGLGILHTIRRRRRTPRPGRRS